MYIDARLEQTPLDCGYAIKPVRQE